MRWADLEMLWVVWLLGLFLLVVWIYLRDSEPPQQLDAHSLPCPENLHSCLILHEVHSSGTGGLHQISPTRENCPLELGVLVRDPRPHVVSSSISSACSGSPPQPAFFSRDAQKKKNSGRPTKKSKGRSMRKGSLSKEGAPSVSRELFGDGELRGSSRDSPGRHGVEDLCLSPSGSQGMTSTSFSTVVVHGEGDPTPFLVGVGTTQGACHTNRLVGLSSTSDPLLDAPDLGLHGCLVGPSDSAIAKHVLRDGKVLGVSLKVEDTVEESRLVALEVRDGVGKASMGDNRGVP